MIFWTAGAEIVRNRFNENEGARGKGQVASLTSLQRITSAPQSAVAIPQFSPTKTRTAGQPFREGGKLDNTFALNYKVSINNIVRTQVTILRLL